jgi:hypothetical protein
MTRGRTPSMVGDGATMPAVGRWVGVATQRSLRDRHHRRERRQRQ